MIYLFEVSICTFIFYALYHFLYQDKVHHVFNRVYLLSALGLSLLLPYLQIPVFPEYLEWTIKTTFEPINPLSADKTSIAMTWQHLLLILYAFGFVVHAVMLAFRLYQLSQIIKTGEKEQTETYTKVYINHKIPLSSFFSYLFIPMEKKGQISSYELQHEQSHIDQKHSLDILFVELCRVLFWFNPLLLLYKKRLVEVHEYLADQSTWTQLGKESYENFLIQQISLKTQQSLRHHFYSLFKKRITMMNSNAKTSTWQYLMILPIFALILTLFSFETYPIYTQNETVPNLQKDSIPSAEAIDTIIVFDPATKKETISYVRKSETSKEKIGENSTTSSRTEIDTVIVFNPDTYKETMYIINYEPGKTDTIK